MPKVTAVALGDMFTCSIDAITTGYYHTCALTRDGSLYAGCCGNNMNGELGTGVANSLQPVQVNGAGTDVAAVAVGANHTCALSGAGAVSCWGLNFDGQLGNGTTSDATAPQPVKCQ